MILNLSKLIILNSKGNFYLVWILLSETVSQKSIDYETKKHISNDFLPKLIRIDLFPKVTI